MSDKWSGLKTSDVWVDWNLGKVSGATIMSGTLDDGPLLTFMQHTINKFDHFERRVTVAAVNIETGEFTEFNNDNINFRELAMAAKSSASIPFVFPPNKWHNRGIFMDGGTVWNLNIEAAVRQCMEIVDDESKITIDTYIVGAPTQVAEEQESKTSLENWYRGYQMSKFHKNTDSVAQSMRAHPTVNYRYIVGQSSTDHLGGLNELNMNGEFTWNNQLAGR